MLQDIMQQLKKAPGLVSKLLITTIKPHTREDELIWSVLFWPTILWFSCEATRIFVYDGIFSFHSLQNMFKNHEAVVYLEQTYVSIKVSLLVLCRVVRVRTLPVNLLPMPIF